MASYTEAPDAPRDHAGDAARGSRVFAPATPVVVEPLVSIWRDKYARGWPHHACGAPPERMSLVDALTLAHDTDAHFAGYQHDMPRRLTTAAPPLLSSPPQMSLLVVDIDAHDGAGATPAWRADLRRRAARLPGAAYGYHTRGGGRLVFLLDEPFAILDEVAAAAWSRRYVRCLLEIACVSGIVGDPACRDWTRLYRAPHATRDGVLQAHGVVCGAPGDVGFYSPPGVTFVDAISLAAALARRSAAWRQALAYVLPAAPLRRSTARPANIANGGQALAYAARHVRHAGHGARNSALFSTARWLGRLVDEGGVSWAEAWRVLFDAATDAGLTEAETRSTLASGMGARR